MEQTFTWEGQTFEVTEEVKRGVREQIKNSEALFILNGFSDVRICRD